MHAGIVSSSGSASTPAALRVLTDLSRAFGRPDYVVGAGGNTSCKTGDTLWIKPSGTCLANMTPEDFVALDRGILSEVAGREPPDDVQTRERLIREGLLSAVRGSAEARRPSVEALLHHALSARFVVHTHPSPVNGMTCARAGARACAELFPEALWVDYADPGYSLAASVRRAMEAYRARRGGEPRVLFLQNHGLFVAADEPDEVHAETGKVFDRLRKVYRRAGVRAELAVGTAPTEARIRSRHDALRAVMGEEAACLRVSGRFDPAAGPLSPDHIVYARAFPLCGETEPDGLESFRKDHGYWPRITACPEGVYAAAGTERLADLALESARQGGLIRHAAEAFGGVHYLDDRARAFIEGWEGEAYRLAQAAR